MLRVRYLFHLFLFYSLVIIVLAETMRILSILILLVLLLPATAYIIKNEKNGKKIEPKRFNVKWPDYHVIGQKAWTMHQQYRKLNNEKMKIKEKLDFQRAKLTIGMKTGMWLVSQASKKNLYWERDQFLFYSYINAYNVSIEVCSIGRKLNYVEFHNYLTQQREKVDISKGPMTFGWEDTIDGVISPIVLSVEYNVTSEWGYPINWKWRFTLDKFVNKDEGTTEWKIFRIEQNGGCPEVGRAKNVITMDTQIMNLEPRIMAMQFYAALGDLPQLYDKWSEMMADGELFSATACTTSVPFSRNSFFVYMEMFLRMWEFKDDMEDDEQTHFNLIMNRPDKYIFRHTLPAIMYKNESGMPELHDSWELKVMMNYNENGDGEWKINHIDLGCPVLRSTTDPILIQYGKKLVYDITKGVEKIANTEVSWTEALDFLDKYIIIGEHASLLNIEVCNDIELANYTRTIWHQYKDWNSKKSFVKVEKIDWSNVKLEESKESFEIILKTTSFDVQNKVRFIDWKFTIGLYQELSYFYVSKLFIGCPDNIRIWKKSASDDDNSQRKLE